MTFEATASLFVAPRRLAVVVIVTRVAHSFGVLCACLCVRAFQKSNGSHGQSRSRVLRQKGLIVRVFKKDPFLETLASRESREMRTAKPKAPGHDTPACQPQHSKDDGRKPEQIQPATIIFVCSVVAGFLSLFAQLSISR